MAQNAHTNIHFTDKLFKFEDIIKMLKFINDALPKDLIDISVFCSDINNHNTHSSSNSNLHIPVCLMFRINSPEFTQTLVALTNYQLLNFTYKSIS